MQDVPMTSRKSLKQLQQMKKSQLKVGEPDSQQSTSLGGQEDNSTRGSNNLDKGRSNDWVIPSPWAIYQADMTDKPQWFPHYYKLNKSLVFRIKAFSSSNDIPSSMIQATLAMNVIMRVQNHQALMFILLRNVLRL